MKYQLLKYWFFTLAVLLTLPVLGQELPGRFNAAESEGVKAYREGPALYMEIGANVKGPITIPRLAAPLKSIQWQGKAVDSGLSLQPGTDTWQIRWKARPEGQALLVLVFEDEAKLVSEIGPTTASADGSFYLPAHLATTRGEKIRYEPQPNKNTVGFWVGKKDSAAWTIKLDKPGRFNVAVLQGCGKNQGGSSAVISFISPVKDLTPTLKFNVLETGHFQNFKWVQLGEVQLRHAGEVEVSVAPEQIKKAALMDIRAIHLIRLPDKR